MQEWLPLAPVVVVGYFIAFPNQYSAFVYWAARFVH